MSIFSNIFKDFLRNFESPQERYYRERDEALRQEKAEQHPHELEQEKSLQE